MKKITRILIFSGVAIYLTSLWNKGFNVNYNPQIFIKTLLIIALFYYLIMPLTRLILLPINFLTLGIVSSIIYFLLFYIIITRFSLIQIKPWHFSGLHFKGLSIKSMDIGYLTNIFLSSASLSFVIKILETLL